MLHLVYTRCVTSLAHIVRKRRDAADAEDRSVSRFKFEKTCSIDFLGHFGIDNILLLLIRLSVFVWSHSVTSFLQQKEKRMNGK